MVDDVSLVTVSLALNLILLESLLVSLSNGVPFVRILQLLDEQYNSEEGEVPKNLPVFLLLVLTLSFCVVWEIVWFDSTTNKEQTRHVGLFMFQCRGSGSSVRRWCCDLL